MLNSKYMFFEVGLVFCGFVSYPYNFFVSLHVVMAQNSAGFKHQTRFDTTLEI